MAVIYPGLPISIDITKVKSTQEPNEKEQTGLKKISQLSDDTGRHSLNSESSTDNLRVLMGSAKMLERSSQTCSINISSQLKMLNTEREETE